LRGERPCAGDGKQGKSCNHRQTLNPTIPLEHQLSTFDLAVKGVLLDRSAGVCVEPHLIAQIQCQQAITTDAKH
jgi:hypothetical protein